MIEFSLSCDLGIEFVLLSIIQYKSRKIIDLNTSICNFNGMAKKERTHYNTTLDVNLLKRLKFLSVELNKRHNELIEKAIELLLDKYENQPKE